MFTSDLEILLGAGLETPYVAAGSLISYLSESACMVHKLFPSLGDLVEEEDGALCALFVSKLPAIEALEAVAIEREPTTPAEDGEQEWLIQVEAGALGWQFIYRGFSRPELKSHLIMLEWVPGGFNKLLDLHDCFVAESKELKGMWKIDSEIEKEAFSRYMLMTGGSTLFAPYDGLGFIDQAIASMGEEVFVGKGACSTLRAYPVEWKYL